MTLRTRLTVAFVLVVLVPLLVGAVLVMRLVPAAVEGRQLSGLSDTAQTASNVLAGYCHRAQAAAIAAGRASSGLGPKVATPELARLVEGGIADGLRVLDSSGDLVGESGRLPTTPVSCESGAAVDEPFITQVLELRTPTGAPAGTVIAAFEVDTRFATLLRDATRKDVVALYAGDRVVAATGTVSGALLDAARAAGGDGVVVGGQAAVFRRATESQPLGLLVVEPVEAGPGVLPVASLVLLGAVGLASLIALVLARATTRPLEELGEAAARIAAGDLETTIPVRSRDEVGTLAAAFNDMTEDLRTYIRALEASRDELQAGLARLGDTLSSTHDLDGILAVVLETAMAATRARAGMVLLLSPDRSELVLRVGRGLEPHRIPDDLRMPAGTGVSGRVASGGEPVVGRVGIGPGALHGAVGEPTATSMIAVPLRSGGQVIGVLDLFDRADAEDFTESDLATIRTFASQASVAVDNVVLHEEAQRLSITDGLTGLWNYRYFTMTVAKEIERAARFGRPLTLLMIDVDHFKAVNDTHGHPRGDAVLVELAGRVKSQVRDVDTLARYGGEELVVVLPETDEEGGQQAAERICDAVRRRPFGDPGQDPVDVTVSIGVAVFPLHGASSSTLLRRADEALYDAKDSGRDTWRTAGPRVVDLSDLDTR
ncbi:MAG: diguanylate cyclase [Mycobacteriales bacterium]|nr:diguanylate cyclase [Mycobacteriales bacterium]